MQLAIIQVCVDDRLNHEQLRIQVWHKLAELYLKADHVFIVNELGGNMGANFRNLLDMTLQTGTNVVLAGVLHHDDCLAHQAGFRRPMDDTLAQMTRALQERKINCPLVSGNIYTANNHIVWLADRKIAANSPKT